MKTTNKAANLAATTAASKKAKNSIDWSLVTNLSKEYKVKSVFRVLDALNGSELFKACKINKPLTIDDLKVLCPEQFEQKINKAGKPVQREWKPFIFAVELRKQYGG